MTNGIATVNNPEKALAERIRQLRRRHFGPRGKDEFARCLTEKLLTYALGRGLEHYDRYAVDRITKALAAGQYKFSTLVLEVVTSDPFQKRRVKGATI